MAEPPPVSHWNGQTRLISMPPGRHCQTGRGINPASATNDSLSFNAARAFFTHTLLRSLNFSLLLFSFSQTIIRANKIYRVQRIGHGQRGAQIVFPPTNSVAELTLRTSPSPLAQNGWNSSRGHAGAQNTVESEICIPTKFSGWPSARQRLGIRTCGICPLGQRMKGG